MQLGSLTAYPGIVVAGVRSGMAHNVMALAAAIAYNAFLAVPASLMVVLGVFTLVERPEDVAKVVDNFDNVLPPEAQTLITETLRRLTDSQDGGPLLLVGLAIALWSVSGALTTMMWALTMAATGRRDQRSFVRKRLVALALLGCVLLGAATLLVLQVFGPTIARESGHDLGGLLDLLRWPVLVCVTVPGDDGGDDNRARRRGRAHLEHAAARLGVRRDRRADRLGGLRDLRQPVRLVQQGVGSLSGVIVLLVWLWLSGLAILLGGEINAEAARRREAAR